MSKTRRRRLRGIGETDPYIVAVKHCQAKFSGRALYACESGVDYLFDSQRGRALEGRRRRRG